MFLLLGYERCYSRSCNGRAPLHMPRILFRINTCEMVPYVLVLKDFYNC
jgi:hypothetical protein